MVSQGTPEGSKWDRHEEETAQQQAEQAEPAAEAAQPDESADDGSPEAEQDPLEILRAEAEALRGEVADLKDQLLRALAETENVRNRAKRDREEALRYAAAPLAKEMLPVADNLRRAIESVPAEAAEEDERLKNLLVGVEMTEKSLLEALAKHGVAQVNPVGERLDPHRHEAMMEVNDPSQPPGTVSQVFEIGYVLHERLLRPARVAVATGGQAAPPGEQVDTEA